MKNKDDERLGTVTLDPQGSIVAGCIKQWRFVYTAGSYGIDEGGTIMLVQRTASDWEVPQFDRPDQSGYTTLHTDSGARLSARFERKAYVRPWNLWCLLIDIHDDSLAPGDRLSIVLGDQSLGSPGIRAQTFAESAHEFRFLVDPTNASFFRRLNSSPICPIVAGEADRITCIVPTQIMVGEEVEVFARGEDVWGNPTPIFGNMTLSAGGEADIEITANVIKARSPGRFFLSALADQMSCRSNPSLAQDSKPSYLKFWGDLHAQTATTVGTGTDEEYFAFARDKARLDFVSHQGNDFQVSDDIWRHLGEVIKTFNDPGKFVVFPGYEWSGNTPNGGDHNVIYVDDDQPIFRSSHWQIPDVPEDDMTPACPIDQLFDRLRENGNAILIPHVGGRYADLRRYFDQALEPVVEIVSCWGIFEWMLWDALDQGYMVGVVCNSDGHKGRPGAEGPGAGMFGIQNGLTCILAEALTRESLFNALKNRRCYGTTGARIDLSFEADGHPMGSYLEVSDAVKLSAEVIGTSPLEALYLYEGRHVIETMRPASFSHTSESKRIRVSWEGSRIRGRARRATWDGAIYIDGARIINSKVFAFDSPTDGIVDGAPDHVRFKSSTTGDMDGIDLFLDQGKVGHLKFDSMQGSCDVDFSELNAHPFTFDLGGLGLKVTVQRYPEKLEEEILSFEYRAEPPRHKTTPYLLKVIQEDGHMAWASPIYVRKS